MLSKSKTNRNDPCETVVEITPVHWKRLFEHDSLSPSLSVPPSLPSSPPSLHRQFSPHVHSHK